MRRRLVMLVVMAALGGCATQKEAVSLTAVRFEEVDGFAQDDPRAALRAFRDSCTRGVPAGASGFPGALDPVAWRRACNAAPAVVLSDARAARRFFLSYFAPYRVDGAAAHFTGYYVPVLKASLTRQGDYRIPVYAFPPELKDRPAGATYFDRAAIDGGALAGRGLELLWCADPVMLFFAQVQGSAMIELTDGQRLRLSYAGKNGHPYRAIGRTLVERGELKAGSVSLQTIRAWLYAHPEQAAEVMQTNPSYIFFSLDTDASGVRGSHGSTLEPERSLAVDASAVPLGLPLFVSTRVGDTPFRRVMLAQDTGSAIRGGARGDIFFGYGEAAEAKAGAMNAGGTLYLLLPRGKADE